MCNRLKTADRRAKRNCICRALLMSDSLSSGWGHLVHFVTFPMIRCQKATASTVSGNFNQTLWIQSIAIGEGHVGCYLLAIC